MKYVISQLNGPGTSCSHLVLRTSKRNNPQRQHGRDKAAGIKNLKSAFFGTPSMFLAAFLCLLLPDHVVTRAPVHRGGSQFWRQAGRSRAGSTSREALSASSTATHRSPRQPRGRPRLGGMQMASTGPCLANSSRLSNFSSTSRSSSSFSYFSSLSMRSPLCSVHPAGLVRGSENHEGTFVTGHCRAF